MAYGIKYYRNVTDRFDNLWVIILSFKDYTGSQSEFIGAGEPLELLCEDSSGDPFSPIKTKSARISIIARTFQQYIDLQNASLYQVECKIIKNTHLYFQGWVRPDEYSEEVQNQAHLITITAVCGLTLLKDIDFDPSLVLVPYSVKYMGILTAFDIIRICLLSTKITLILLDGAEFFPINSDISPDEDITALKQYYVHRGSLRNDDGYKDCYTILADLLQAQGCRIVQEYVEDQGLCWLIEPILKLDVEHSVRSINLNTLLEESTKVEINSFVRVTDAQGTPLTVITDLSGIVEIQNTPGTLRLVPDLDYDSNLVKDNFDYAVTKNSQIVELDMEEGQLKIIPIPIGSIPYASLQGIEFPLGYLQFREDIELEFSHSGDCKFEAGLFLYTKAYGVLSWTTQFDQFMENVGWRSFYTYNGDIDHELIYRYGEQRCTYTFPLHIPDSGYLHGRLVLIFRATAWRAGRETHSGTAYLDLNSLSVKVRSHDDIESAKLEKVYSTNISKKEIPLTYSDGVKYKRTQRNQTPWTIYNLNGFMPNFSFYNVFFMHDSDKAKFVEKWKIEGTDTQYTHMDLLLLVYDKIYSQNRLKLSADILGQLNLSSILIFQDAAMLIDRWSLRVKSGIQSVNLLEIGKHEDWLVTESDVIVLTESDESDYILIEQ